MQTRAVKYEMPVKGYQTNDTPAKERSKLPVPISKIICIYN